MKQYFFISKRTRNYIKHHPGISNDKNKVLQSKEMEMQNLKKDIPQSTCTINTQINHVLLYFTSSNKVSLLRYWVQRNSLK